MIDSSSDQFVFGSSGHGGKPSPPPTKTKVKTLLLDATYNPAKKVQAQEMQNPKAQIEALNAAKAEVQSKLDAIFSKLSHDMIFSMANLAEIDNEKLIRLVAESLHMQVTSNWKVETEKSQFVRDLEAALVQIGSDAFVDQDTGWKAAEYYSQWENTSTDEDDHAEVA